MIRFCPNDGTLLMGERERTCGGAWGRRPQLKTTTSPLLPLLLVPVAAGRCPASPATDLAFVCEACPYTHPVPPQPLVASAPCAPRPRADILGGDDAWAAVQKTDAAACPKCSHGTAYFFEVQTRSADEAATLFMRCQKCSHQWREN